MEPLDIDVELYTVLDCMGNSVPSRPQHLWTGLKKAIISLCRTVLTFGQTTSTHCSDGTNVRYPAFSSTARASSNVLGMGGSQRLNKCFSSHPITGHSGPNETRLLIRADYISGRRIRRRTHADDLCWRDWKRRLLLIFLSDITHYLARAIYDSHHIVSMRVRMCLACWLQEIEGGDGWLCGLCIRLAA